MRTAVGPIVALAVSLLLASWVLAPDAIDVAESRAASVTTTACGVASGTSGSAVLIEEGRALTAAHTVIGAGSVEVDFGGVTRTAEIIGLNPRSDLALLEVPGIAAREVLLGEAEAGQQVTYVNGSGDVQTAEVTRRVEIRIEEERSTVRSSRFGFEIDTSVELGDSGAGVFDDRGRLIGVIFGVSLSRDDRSFAVRTQEITELLDTPEERFLCNPLDDRVRPAE